MLKRLIGIAFLLLVLSCGSRTEQTIQVGENTFVHNEIVYRIIDNEITELGSLNSDSIPKSLVLSPRFRDFGEYKMDFVKHGASTNLSAVYRGDILYFNLVLHGLNDLREKYYGGVITISFLDAYNFQIHERPIQTGELIRILGPLNETLYYQYSGKTQMSSEVYRAIENYSVSSSLVKNRY